MVDRDFPSRHIGPDPSERQLMLERLGYDDLDAFTADVVPEVIGWHEGLDLPAAASEPEACGPEPEPTPQPPSVIVRETDTAEILKPKSPTKRRTNRSKRSS